jgi:hypothetical protein
MPKPGSTRRNCVKGYSCGYSCISLRYACRVDFTEGIAVSLDDRAQWRIHSASLSTQPKYYKKKKKEEPPEPKVVAKPKPKLTKDGFPENTKDLIDRGYLGGSTGARLVEDPNTGKKYVLKKGNSPEHVKEEFAADEAYRALGINVPKGKLYEEDGGPVKLTEYVEGVRLYGSLSAAERKKVDAELAKGFVADALLANWDVIGTGEDNVGIGQDGKIYRLDNGGSLRYRAQGAPKGSSFGDTAHELMSLRDPNINNITAAAFGSLTDKDIRDQLEKISKNPKFLEALPPEIKGVIQNRIDNGLKKFGSTTTAKNKTPSNGERVLLMDPLKLGKNVYINQEKTAEKLVNLGVLKNKDDALDLIEALDDWTRLGYESMRKVDSGQDVGSESTKRMVKDINEKLFENDKFPIYGGVVYKGMNLKGAAVQKFMSLKNGDEFVFDSMSSFSSSGNMAIDFAFPDTTSSTGVPVVIQVNNNYRGKSIAPFSSHEEDEVLIPKGTKYRLEETIELTSSSNGKYTLLVVNEVQDEE